MNPEIEKFWNAVGYEITYTTYAINENFWKRFWYLEKAGIKIFWVGESEMFWGTKQDIVKCHRYFINQQEYSEEEMLKIIRMKAFI